MWQREGESALPRLQAAGLTDELIGQARGSVPAGRILEVAGNLEASLEASALRKKLAQTEYALAMRTAEAEWKRQVMLDLTGLPLGNEPSASPQTDGYQLMRDWIAGRKIHSSQERSSITWAPDSNVSNLPVTHSGGQYQSCASCHQ
jgi:hypothetical protein